jgi:hypothetical protein
MPNNQALQVFYGTIPLILILAAIWFREQMLLTDILKRLGALETLVNQVKDQLALVKQRLIALETPAGVIYHE